MTANRNGRRAASLAGTNLEFDERTGMYRWRHVDKRSGKRVRRATGTNSLRRAILIAKQFEEEYDRELAGLSNYGDYRRPLSQFLEPFLESLDVGEARRSLLGSQLVRAFKLLRLSTLADIQDFIKLERKLLRLEGSRAGRFSRKTLRRCFQDPLRQFSKYLAGRREMMNDPLAAWPRLRTDPPAVIRRAIMPEEFVRILDASDWLDTFFHRQHSMRMVWTTLLITAPRVSALAALDVTDISRDERRLLFTGNHRKKAGAGALDDATFRQVVEYIGDRKKGPMFLSPTGTRIDGVRSLDQWRAAASLAFVNLEWPEGEPHEMGLAYRVHLTLTSGRTVVALGGHTYGRFSPGLVKRAEREKLAERIKRIADAVRERWTERMHGIDQHCLRMTHRTWALVSGVPEILIDRQLGHSSPAGDAALNAAWSAIGRAHYTDMNFLALDARRSAQAVREMLDRAETELRQGEEPRALSL